MGIIHSGKYYDSYANLSAKEIDISDNTAKKILQGKESISRTELLNNSLFTKYKDNENFNAIVDMFGSDIDAEELSFLVTALDASKYKNSFDQKKGVKQDVSGIYLDTVFSNSDDVLKASHEDFEQFKQARANAQKPDMGL